MGPGPAFIFNNLLSIRLYSVGLSSYNLKAHLKAVYLVVRRNALSRYVNQRVHMSCMFINIRLYIAVRIHYLTDLKGVALKPRIWSLV